VTRLERRRSFTTLTSAHSSRRRNTVRRPAPDAGEARAALYQAEHLLRQYGFGYDELVFAATATCR